MADTTAEAPVAEAFYSTSRALGTGTTSTVTMQIWRLLSVTLEEQKKPMSASELAEATGLELAQIDDIFSQAYYQKHYGFRRFDSYAAWESWAMAEGVLYNPELHDVQPEEETEEEAPVEEEETEA